jgi:glycosyltransferase involved in cell wall biosynthesis
MTKDQRTSPDTVAFVSVARGLGGPSRSLATVLEHLEGRVQRVLFAPRGSLVTHLEQQHAVDTFIVMPRGRRLARGMRLIAAFRFAAWVVRHRHRIMAIHANGQAELNIAAPAAVMSGVPLIVWGHASRPSPSLRVLGALWRRVVRDLRVAAVSPEAQQVLVDSRLVKRPREIPIIPNPIDPRHVVAGNRVLNSRVTIGYLKGKSRAGGWDLLPAVIESLADMSLRWLLFTNPVREPIPPELQATWDRLRPLLGEQVEMCGKVPDVATAYGRCDIIFCPSREESFGRVAAEAMLNGLPVVATDIPALRRLLGDEEAGLLFPAEDAATAATQIRRLVDDFELRNTLGDRGRTRASPFLPSTIVPSLHDLYLRDRQSQRQPSTGLRFAASGSRGRRHTHPR